MASYTVVLNGETSELESNFYPPISLDGDYVCGLIDFQSYMSIPNITSRNNRVYYFKNYDIELEAEKYYTMEMLREQYLVKKPHATKQDIERFETSVYNEFSTTLEIFQLETDVDLIKAYQYFTEIDNKKVKAEYKKIRGFGEKTRFVINNLPKDWIGEGFKLDKLTRFISSKTDPYTLKYGDAEYLELPVGSYELSDIETAINELMEPILKGFRFTVRLSKVTLKCTLDCTHQLFGRNENSVASVFGFGPNQTLYPYKFIVAESTVNIMLVNAIKFDCNIVSGSYSNGSPVHTIHEFFPTVGVGYKLVETPQNVIYLPVATRSISNICVRIVDQNDNLVDFRGETITIRLHIKKV